MNFKDHILSLDYPYCLGIYGENESVQSRVMEISIEETGIWIVTLDGDRMQDLDSFYDAISSALNFPDYFGRNFNALSECLADLELELSVKGILILVRNASLLLAEENEDVLSGLLSIFNETGEAWSEAIEEGEEWDRPARIFKTFLIFEKSSCQGHLWKKFSNHLLSFNASN